jgi:type I restriction enzyme M protein
MLEQHHKLADFIWSIANMLRGPYRPPQYRKVMLPLIVLRRLDCVLEPTKEKVLAQYKDLKKKGLSEAAVQKTLAKIASKDRVQPLYNISPYTFQKLMNDPNGLAKNLTAYIKGFSPKVREVFEKFELSNLAMGYVFENLIRRFNEQANEEAGDHFTPREVIRLMAHLIYTGDEDIYTPGISRTIYDPTCGTGGMLSVSEEYIREHNSKAHLALFGQEYNPESYAICCSDLLIKDEPLDNIVFGDTLGDGKTSDGHAGKTFHYMLANPPFGVEWKTQQKFVQKEHDNFGFEGRFGPGLPRINDGALLFLLNMIAKRKPAPQDKGEGSKIAIVFNGSPLFTGDAASGESNVRRWIIENDWLDTIVAMPDQLFYNTGIFTYVWLVTNRKQPERRGTIQLIDATQHFERMRKNLGDKRNLMSEDHIKEITRLYAEHKHEAKSSFLSNNEEREAVCSKIFKNIDFGYLKITIERPLRLNFQTSPERIENLRSHASFVALASSKKRKNKSKIAAEEKAGSNQQEKIIASLSRLNARTLYKNRDKFQKDLDRALHDGGVILPTSIRKAIIAALSERDQSADICRDGKGNPEADPELRDLETVQLPKSTILPLPIGYEDKADNTKLVALVRSHCGAYFNEEVRPHWPDAWIDFSKTKVGYEIPIARLFYSYQMPRPLVEIESDIKALESEIVAMLKEVA